MGGGGGGVLSHKKKAGTKVGGWGERGGRRGKAQAKAAGEESLERVHVLEDGYL